MHPKRKYNIQDEMSLFQDYTWVKKVIASCETHAQHSNADNLIEFLESKYRFKVDLHLLKHIINDLNNIWIDKTYEL